MAGIFLSVALYVSYLPKEIKTFSDGKFVLKSLIGKLDSFYCEIIQMNTLIK